MSASQLVLIAEDDPAVAEFLQLALRALGHETLVASDGQAALDRAGERPPDLVLLDALLPRVDGFGVLRALRESHPQVPVVMMSGIYRKRSYQQEAMDLGAREYLFKPVSVLQIWELADRYLGEAGPSPEEPADSSAISFNQQPLARVLADLLARALTGMLLLRGPSGTGLLFVEDGRIVFGRSNDPQTRLDRILEAQGALGPEAKLESRQLLNQGKGKARFGDLLVEAGHLSPEQLRAALAEQQRLHVTRPLTWTEGSSRFFESEAPRQESFKLDMNMEALVVWAARHVPGGPALEDWLPRSNVKLRAVGELAAEAGRYSLTEDEAKLLALCDGSRSTGALRAIGRLAQIDFDRVGAALCSLEALEGLPAEEPATAGSNDPLGKAPAAGSLDVHRAARVLLGTARAGKTGLLSFEGAGPRAGASARVWVDRGFVAFAASNDPRDRLPDVLQRSGLVSPEQLAAALEAARARPGSAVGRILVEQGTLQLDDLAQALEAQVRRVVTGLLAWGSGTFNFTEGDLPCHEIVPLSLEPFELVLGGLRGAPVAALADALPAEEARLQKTWRCFELCEQLELGSLEARLLEELEEQPAVGGLLSALGAPPEEGLRALHLLLALGLVEEAASPSGAGESEALSPPASEAMPAPAGAASLLADEFGNESFASLPDLQAATAAARQSAAASAPINDDEFGNESFASLPGLQARGGSSGAPAATRSEEAGIDDFGAAFTGESFGGPAAPDSNTGEPEAPEESSFTGLIDETAVVGAAAGAGGFALDSADDETFGGAPAGTAPDAARPAAASESFMAAGLDETLGGAPAGAPEPGCSGPVTGMEDSFAGLFDDETLEGALPPGPPAADGAAAVDPGGGFAPSFEQGPPRAAGGPDFVPDLAGPSATPGPVVEAPAPSARGSAPAAVLERPDEDPGLLFALQNFLALLADHVATHPGSVPEHVLAMLPADLRERFGM